MSSLSSSVRQVSRWRCLLIRVDIQRSSHSFSNDTLSRRNGPKTNSPRRNFFSISSSWLTKVSSIERHESTETGEKNCFRDMTFHRRQTRSKRRWLGAIVTIVVKWLVSVATTIFHADCYQLAVGCAQMSIWHLRVDFIRTPLEDNEQQCALSTTRRKRFPCSSRSRTSTCPLSNWQRSVYSSTLSSTQSSER